MIINLKRLAKLIDEKKANPAPQPLPRRIPEAKYYHLHVLSEPPRSKPGRLNPLWHEFDKVKVDRAKLSDQIFDKVKGGATTEDLKGLVDLIKDLQPRLENLFDQARYVDQYGTLPKIEVKQEESTPEQKPW